MSIPNTLTIFINTRIRNYKKLKYQPSMTIPNIKSESVCFTPLVKLNKSITQKLKRGMPESELYTQFFNKNEFYSLIDRTLSQTGQKKKTLIDATKEGIVDNNIRIILDQLFSPNQLFYIKNKPYTIFSYEWTNGDWKIDTKSFEKKIAYIPYGSNINYSLYRQLNTDGRTEQSEAKKELKKLESINPEIVNGPTSEFNSSNFKRIEIQTPKIQNAWYANDKQLIEDNTKQYLEKISQTIPKSLQTLIGRDTIKQDAINTNADVVSIPSDPISLTLLYSKDRNFIQDINNNKATLEPLYNELQNSKQNFNNAINNYENELGINLNTNSNVLPIANSISGGATDGINLMTSKIDYDNSVNKLNNLIDKYKNENYSLQDILLNENLKNSLTQLIIGLYKQKIIFLNSYYEVLNLLLDKINKQVIYIESLIRFYSKLYNIKLKELKGKGEKFKLDTFSQLMQFDIKCYQSLLANDTFKDYIKDLKKKFSKVQNFIKKITSEKYNYREKFELYYEFPQIINIEKNEFDIYILYLIEFNEQNESNIWQVLFEETDKFFDIMNNEILKNISNARILQEKYEKTYTKQQRDSYEDALDNFVPSQKQSLLSFKSIQFTNNKQKIDYDNLQKSIVICYDSITIYSQFSAIYYAREIGLLTTKKNHTNIQIRIFNAFIKYYENIQINTKIIENLLPPLYWNIPSSQEEIPILIEKNKDLLEIVEKNNEFFKNEYDVIESKYKDILDKLIPQITSKGILNSCSEIVNTLNIKNITPITPQSKLDDLMVKYYDQDETSKFISKLIEIYIQGVNDKILPELNNDELLNILNGWQVYDDERVGDCFFSAITLAFNGELVVNNKLSNNVYSDPDGYYSISSLRRAVSNGITQDIINGWSIFKNLENEQPNSPNRRDYNFLFDNNRFIGDDINKVKEVILKNASDGGKYWGDEIAIGIIEKTFKIKLIIINKDEDDINNLYKITCYDPDHTNYENANEFNHYIFLLFKKVGDSSHYEVLYNIPNKKFIFTMEEIPDYFKYLIFKNCIQGNKTNSWFYSNAEFKNYSDGLISLIGKNKYNKVISTKLSFKKSSSDSSNEINTIKGGGTRVPKQLYMGTSNPLQDNKGESKLSYYIIIDLELYPGENIPLSQKALLTCQNQYEKIKKSYSDIFELEYRPSEFYPSVYAYDLSAPPPSQSLRPRNNAKTRRYNKYPKNYYTRRYNRY